jgi:tetratricopeptide (TPR) repeat protein
LKARIDGLSHKEISERFGISVQASLSRLHRARKKLTDHVKNLLYCFFGLLRVIHFKKLVSGGVVAMKIGASVKMTIGVVSIIVIGFTVFQLIGPGIKFSGEGSRRHSIEQINREESTPKSVDYADKSEKDAKRHQEAITGLSTQLDEISDSEAEAFMGILNAMEQSTSVNKTASEESISESDVTGFSEISSEDDHKRQTLFDKAEWAFNAKSYAEAIELYQEVYDKYPDWNYASTALKMIGLSYSWLGKNDKSIEYYERSIREYPGLIGFNASTYYYLGTAYIKAYRSQEALNAFRECIHLCKVLEKDPDQFPYKNAMAMIRDLEKG